MCPGYRWLTVSVLLVAFSMLQATTITTEQSESLPHSGSPGVSEKNETLRGLTKSSNKVKRQVEAEYERDDEYAVPTMRPPRTCVPPDIEQFPIPLIRQQACMYGGLVIHVLVCVFTFIGVTVACQYFVASLERICQELKLAPDVAGATFMAVGSSAPELATAIVGNFCAQDDLGPSHVLGSAVCNIMFVISVCALCAGTVSHLNWWPLCRDCFFYALSILVMLCTIANGYVSWPEALLMLIIYAVYCIALRFNSTLERWAMAITRPSQRTRNTREKAEESTREWSTREETGDEQIGTTLPLEELEAPAAPAYYKFKDTAVDALAKPVGANPLQLACWYVAYPIHWSCRHTMPDCRGPWYPVTFLISMLWISFYSYFMVWMVTIIGYTLGIPDSVMGLTIVAASMSVPDAVTSLKVIKEGYGDMAVSNAVGSNVFDILVCLGLPWFIQTAIIQPGSHVNVISKGLIYSTLSLFSTVIFLVVATHANGWKLDRKYGAVLMLWYLLFITFASLYELNVFGNYLPASCSSIY